MSPGTDTRPTVVLAALTFRRPEMLRDLVPLLTEQAQQAVDAGFAATVLIVDNDPAGSGADVVGAHAAATPAVRYVHEPTPGLSAARNRALAEARQADALVFIDDDETPGDGWLVALLSLWRASGAAAITGPVRTDLPVDVDPWVPATGLFARRRHATGSTVGGLATNNLVLDLAFVRAHGLGFDPRFTSTGGEDSKFGQDVIAAGGRIVWCDEAEVCESTPAARLERAWVTRRLIRFGESWVRARVIDLPPLAAFAARAKYLVKGTTRVLCGLATAGWHGVRRSRDGQGRAAAVWAGGLGMVRGAIGMNWEEYRRR